MARGGALLERGLAPAGACARWRQREKDPVDFVWVYALPVSPAGQAKREKASLESGGGGAVVPSAARTIFRCEREGRGRQMMWSGSASSHPYNIYLYPSGTTLQHVLTTADRRSLAKG